MSGLRMVVTDAGRDAIVAAHAQGLDGIVMSQVAIGDGNYVPVATQDALQNETKRINTIAGDAVDGATVHVTVRDSSSDVYEVSEIGMYTDAGVLFAVYSQAEVITEKAAKATLLLSLDVQFADIDAQSITFGDTNFVNPLATTQTPGIVQLVNDLTTGGSDKAASAEAAKQLKQLIDAVKLVADGALPASALTDSLTAGGSNIAASAEAAKLLNNMIAGIETVPIGAVMPFAMDNAPTGWLKADGTILSTFFYPDLHAVIGNTFHDEVRTISQYEFMLPDMRSEFVRGWDNGRGLDLRRSFGTTQGYAIQSHNHAYTASHRTSTCRGDGSGNPDGSVRDWGAWTSSTGSDETRPRNIALLYCIKY